MRWLALAVTFVAVVALAGCGVGPGKKLSGGGAQLEITRNFGQKQLYTTSVPEIRKDQTVMRLLESKRNVKLRYGGKFVDGIEGLNSTNSGGHSDWFYFVNGIEASVGAAERTLSPGDVVQWDYRNWDAAMRVPAIVGAYPEPFLRGSEGKRLPVRIECAEPGKPACDDVQKRLSDLGVPAASSVLGSSAGPKTLRVVVGPWSKLRSLSGAVGSLDGPPSASGVFARFSSDGRSLRLLDDKAHPVRNAPPGSGLVAATATEGSQPVWVITGLNDAGVDAAARSLTKDALHNAYAVAVMPGGNVRLPVIGGAG
jgi:Domain of unknown function (DUF4430)